MLASYINERYPMFSHLVEDYARLCHEQGRKLAQYPYGFFMWKEQGDALVLYDMYTADDYRAKGYAWSLFYDVKQLAKALNKHVILTFSEHLGPKQELGLGAIKAANFIPVFDTKEQSVWIRGVN